MLELRREPCRPLRFQRYDVAAPATKFDIATNDPILDGTPSRGAKADGLLLSDERIADPMRIVSSNTFDYGNFTAQFGADIGSRLMFDSGRGVGDIARVRIA